MMKKKKQPDEMTLSDQMWTKNVEQTDGAWACITHKNKNHYINSLFVIMTIHPLLYAADSMLRLGGRPVMA